MKVMAYSRWRRVIFVSVMVLASCGAQAPNEPDPDGPAVLFVGNSLTYFNDLPGIVSAMIDSSTAPSWYVEELAFPNFGLEDHWVTGAREKIASRAWDIVVLQQGPSATEGRPSLLEYSVRFNEEVEKAGGRTAMYMVWPAANRAFDFDGVSESYTMAADQFGGLVFPAGEAWRAAWAVDSELALYGPDGFHPSPMGSYLAALVIFEQLTGLSADEAPNGVTTALEGFPILIPETTATLLKTAATTANQAFSRP